jgi:hypothetical protein
MANPTLSLPLQCESFLGYISNPANAGASHPSSPGPSYLAEPSVNCMINETNQVCQRLGYTLEFNIGVTGKTATCFYHKTYDIAFFAIDTKLYYRDFNTNTTVDTGRVLLSGLVISTLQILQTVLRALCVAVSMVPYPLVQLLSHLIQTELQDLWPLEILQVT